MLGCQTAGNSSTPNSRGRKGDREQLGSCKGSLEPKPRVGPGVTAFCPLQPCSGARSLQKTGVPWSCCSLPARGCAGCAQGLHPGPIQRANASCVFPIPTASYGISPPAGLKYPEGGDALSPHGDSRQCVRVRGWGTSTTPSPTHGILSHWGLWGGRCREIGTALTPLPTGWRRTLPPLNNTTSPCPPPSERGN